MRFPITMLLAALPIGAASAETIRHAHGAELLPPACLAAAGPVTEPPPALGGMADITQASDGIMPMHAAMAQAATISDPDLAFNCGMIAHHRGAIAMAKTELKTGTDAASRALAEAIIAAQEDEIAAMTVWVEQHAR